MSPLGIIVLIILVMLIFGGLPFWGYTAPWSSWGGGYGFSGVGTILLIIVLILLFR